MPTHKVKLIINPNADLGRAWRWASDLRPIVDEFGGADWTGTVYPTHAIELARRAGEEGYETVVAVGGDGTVHEVINGLMQLPPEKRPRLGVVPMGSGNDFAHNSGIQTRPELAMRQVFTGQSKKVDLIKVKDGHGRQEFLDNTLGIGFDTTVTIRSRRVPIVRGFFIYLIAVIQTILLNHDAPHMRVKTDRENWEDDIIMLVVCNGAREGGGFFVAPGADTSDGVLDYVYIKKVSRLMMFRLLPEVMKGTHGRFRQVGMGKLTSLSLSADRPLYIHVDGEIFAGFGTDVRQLEVELIPAALEMIV